MTKPPKEISHHPAHPRAASGDDDHMSAPLYEARGKGGRWYQIPSPPLPEACFVPSVTNILSSGMPAPALKKWGEKMVAEFAYDNKDAFLSLDRDAAVDLLKGAPYRSMSKAGNRGTDLHTIAEAVMRGEDLGDWALPYAQHIDHIHQFMSEWNVTPLYLERTVVQPGKPGYAGSFDFIADVDGVITLGDWKSSKGIYPKNAVQCAAYAHAKWMLSADGQSHEPMPHVDQVGIVHLTDDGYGWYPSTAPIDGLYEAFCSIHDVAMFELEHGKQVLSRKPFTPPDRQAVRDDLVARVRQVVEWGGGADLAGQWPAQIPTFKASTDHNTQQLDAIEYLLRRVEHQWRPPDPVASREHHDDLIGRLVVLPDSLIQKIQVHANAAEIPNLRTYTATTIQLEQLTRIADIVEKAPDVEDRTARLHRATKGRTTNPSDVTDDEVAAFMRTRSTRKQATKQGAAA